MLPSCCCCSQCSYLTGLEDISLFNRKQQQQLLLLLLPLLLECIVTFPPDSSSVHVSLLPTSLFL